MKWFPIVNRKRCPLINSIMLSGIVTKHRKDFPYDYTAKHYAYVDGQWYGDEETEADQTEEIARFLEGKPRLVLDLLEGAHSEWAEFESYLKTLNELDLKGMSNLRLKDEFDRIVQFLLEWNRFLQNIIFLETIYTKKLKKFLGEKSSDPEQDFLLLTSPSREGFFEEENKRMFELMQFINSDPQYSALFKKDAADVLAGTREYPGLRKQLETHLIGWAWLGNADFKGVFWSLEDVVTRIKETFVPKPDEKLEEVERIKAEREQKLGALVDSLAPDENTLLDIKTAREMVHFRTFRTDIQWKTGFYSYMFFREIAQRMAIPAQEFYNFFYFEISEFLKTGVIDKRLIEKRKKGYAIMSDMGKDSYYYGEDIAKVRGMVEQKVQEDVSELKGTVANPGCVKGTVRIVRSVDDLGKVREGDVLVTYMTKPAYIVAMEKASAFVTDEGGILCHAAIISREMGKPCVIGTGSATKVFNDGDVVEVDADKGVVRIVQNGK
jgi:phosphohistidine swiveling domain-containing protein